MLKKRCFFTLVNQKIIHLNPLKPKTFFRDNDQTTSITHLCKSGFVSILDENNKLSDTIGKQVLKLLEEEW